MRCQNERREIYMGDGVNAPKTMTLQVNGELSISQFLKQLADALPTVADPEPIVWSVHLGQSKGNAIGLIETVYQVRSRVTVFGSDLKCSKAASEKCIAGIFARAR